MNAPAIELPAAAMAALESGNRVEAVRVIRELAGCSLRDAHAAMDAYVQARPALVALFDAQRAETAQRAPTDEEAAAAAAEAWALWND